MYYNDLNTSLKTQYGCKVYKLALSSGCSCPNRDGTVGYNGCIFCDGAGAFAEAGDIAAQLEAAKKRVHLKVGREAKYIAYFQSFTNTYAPAEKLRPLFIQAIAPEDIVALSVATRPDCLPDDIMELLAELNRIKPVWVELGLQTIHEETAKYIRRGYDLPVFDEAVKKLKSIGVTVIVHQILGLPGETAEMMVETSRYIGSSGADGIKLHLLHVLEGTDLADHWREGQFKTLEMEEYIDILESCLRVLPPETVIHRLTGDGAKKDLLAPLWSADKKRVLNAISAAFKRDNVVQGSYATHFPSTL
ncbi:MAG: TIGR01212 family radical SAM protein [Ruminococcaceae bacterium]|nr:TIGR01212 family radical SAM protein [Oscillospiraceae bacterium]